MRLRITRRTRQAARPPVWALGCGFKVMQAVVAASAGAAFGFSAAAGLGTGALQGFVGLLVASGVVVVLGREHLVEVLTLGAATPEREAYASRVLRLCILPPLFLALAVLYLAVYEHGGLWAPPSENMWPRGAAFGLVTAAAVWLLVDAAVIPMLAIGARKRAPAAAASWPPSPADLAGSPWPDTFTAPEEDPYANDAFQREDEVRRFCEVLLATPAPAVWSLEGPWGSGKSAFAQMAAAECGRHVNVSRSFVVTAPLARLGGSPLFDLAAALAHGLSPTNEGDPPTSIGRLVNLALPYAEPLRLAQELRAGDDPRGVLDEFATAVRAEVEKLDGHAVLWIDDLDRCPPDYALEMLHAVRAVTACRGLMTVLVLNHEVLVASVRQRYGLGPEAEDYLRRFLDFRIAVPPLTRDSGTQGGLRERWMHQRAEAVGLAASMEDNFSLGVLTAAAWVDGLSLRDLEQLVYRAAVVLGGIPIRHTPTPAEPPADPASHRIAKLAVCGHVLLNVLEPERREEALGLVTRDNPLRAGEAEHVLRDLPTLYATSPDDIGACAPLAAPDCISAIAPALQALRDCYHEHHRGMPDLGIVGRWASEIMPPRDRNPHTPVASSAADV